MKKQVKKSQRELIKFYEDLWSDKLWENSMK